VVPDRTILAVSDNCGSPFTLVKGLVKLRKGTANICFSKNILTFQTSFKKLFFTNKIFLFEK